MKYKKYIKNINLIKNVNIDNITFKLLKDFSQDYKYLHNQLPYLVGKEKRSLGGKISGVTRAYLMIFKTVLLYKFVKSNKEILTDNTLERLTMKFLLYISQDLFDSSITNSYLIKFGFVTKIDKINDMSIKLFKDLEKKYKNNITDTEKEIYKNNYKHFKYCIYIMKQTGKIDNSINLIYDIGKSNFNKKDIVILNKIAQKIKNTDKVFYKKLSDRISKFL